MKEKHLLNEYYKRRLYGGKSRLARCVDFFVFRLILFVVVYLWLSSKLADPFLQWFLSGVSLLLFSVAAELYKSIRLDRFKKKELERLRQLYIRTQILFLSGEAYTNIVHSYARAHKDAYDGACLVLPLQKSEPLGADTLLAIYRLALLRNCNTVALFSPAPVAESAQQYLRQKDANIILQSDAVFCAMAKETDIWPDDEAIEAYILDKLDEEKQQRKKSAEPFASGRVKRYLAVALVLFAASFFVQYTLYYRLMAVMCMSFASLCWWIDKSAPVPRE